MTYESILVLIVFFFHKQIDFNKDVGHNMLHLHVAQQLPPITLSSWTGEFSPNDKYADAKHNPNIIFDI